MRNAKRVSGSSSLKHKRNAGNVNRRRRPLTDAARAEIDQADLDDVAEATDAPCAIRRMRAARGRGGARRD